MVVTTVGKAMVRSRPRRRISGWLVIDKPVGMTSAAVVDRVRRLTGAAKVGHAGTLDPLATGVLPVALGEATKTMAYVVDSDKTYRFRIRWGEARATDDADGEVIATTEARPTAEEIRRALPELTGDILQRPPIYSAIKVNGKRAYALARADKPVALEPRRVRIHRLDLKAIVDRDHAEFEACCGKGAYMRSLARDLAERLGTLGHIAALRRTAVGRFTEDDAISLDHLGALGHSARVLEQLRPVETALDGIPALALTESEASRLKNGRAVPVLRAADRALIDELGDGAVVCAMSGGKAVALTRVDGFQIRPVRVLHL